MPTTIDPAQQVVTLINVFTVEPERQQELVDLLDRATDEVMRHLPGFVSANLHASLDGSRVVNYAQWRSVADFQAMLANPDAGSHLKAALDRATAAPHLYAVRSIHPSDVT